MTLLIPRLLHQIWVGPKAPPHDWMQTWVEHHPSWKYVLWGDKELHGRRWELQDAIDYYSSKAIWPGVADCMRYEILHEYGGFMPGADSVCERPVDELFTADAQEAWWDGGPANYHSWAVYEQEEVVPDYITPVYAAQPGSDFCWHMIREIRELKHFQEPWVSVGNQLMGEVYRQYCKVAAGDMLTVWPSWYFNPIHHTGVKHIGTGKPYARQMWGNTKGLYDE